MLKLVTLLDRLLDSPERLLVERNPHRIIMSFCPRAFRNAFVVCVPERESSITSSSLQLKSLVGHIG